MTKTLDNIDASLASISIWFFNKMLLSK